MKRINIDRNGIWILNNRALTRLEMLRNAV